MIKNNPGEKGLNRGLGKGLSALLGDDFVDSPVTPSPADEQRHVPIELLHPNPFQPRQHFDTEALEELSQSIRVRGILQPILVRPYPGRIGEYQIVAGERRWRGAQRAQVTEVPVVVRDFDNHAALEVAILENIQRQDLSPLEEAEGYRRLIEEFGNSQEEIARLMGKSRPHIANTLRLIGLPAAVKELLEQGQISAGHARALLKANSPVTLAQEIIIKNLSVRETEELVRQERGPQPFVEEDDNRSDTVQFVEDGIKKLGDNLEDKSGTKRVLSGRLATGKTADTRALENQLEQVLGLKANLKTDGSREKGSLTLYYSSLDQLDEVLGRLLNDSHI